MINFFRKYRRGKLNAKYIKYAIGEIFLVVVGILIAIGINNFNQSLKNQKVHERLVSNLTLEFEENFSQILTVSTNQSQSVAATKELLEAIKIEKVAPLDSVRLWLALQGNIWTFNPKNGVLRNAISSGNIHLLKSDSLKNLLFGWEGQTSDIVEEQERLFIDYDRLLQVLEKHIQGADIMNYYKDWYSGSAFPSNYDGLLSDPQFEDVLINHGQLFLDHLEELQALKMNNDLIIQLLKEE